MNKRILHANENLSGSNGGIDYSEIYKKQELKQLNKRLRRARNILLLCAVIIVGGAAVFWMMPYSYFKTKEFTSYSILAFFFLLMALYSRKRPYISILSALIVSIIFWAAEVVLNTTDDLLIEGAIQKLIVVSLLVSSLHASKEAELIRKELFFT